MQNHGHAVALALRGNKEESCMSFFAQSCNQHTGEIFTTGVDIIDKIEHDVGSLISYCAAFPSKVVRISLPNLVFFPQLVSTENTGLIFAGLPDCPSCAVELHSSNIVVAVTINLIFTLTKCFSDNVQTISAVFLNNQYIWACSFTSFWSEIQTACSGQNMFCKNSHLTHQIFWVVSVHKCSSLPMFNFSHLIVKQFCGTKKHLNQQILFCFAWIGEQHIVLLLVAYALLRMTFWLAQFYQSQNKKYKVSHRWTTKHKFQSTCVSFLINYWLSTNKEQYFQLAFSSTN